MEPTSTRFRALARSSPWRWHTLRFEFHRQDRPQESVRGYIRRPDRLRVEQLDGRLLVTASDEPVPRSRALLTSDGGGSPLPRLPPAGEMVPVYDGDGLVAVRPDGARYDDPMFRNYHWVAMLDPVELADPGVHHGSEAAADEVPVRIESPQLVDHHGRKAWEAICYPGDGYDPRCSCCPLLLSRQSNAMEQGGGGPGMPDDFVFAEAHRVRLDLETGVCVLTEELGGSHPGAGHDVVIEAVDEDMADGLFRIGTAAALRRMFGR